MQLSGVAVIEPAPETRTVVVERARYPRGYWNALVGCELHMPAVVHEGRVLSGRLIAVSDDETEITLTFSELAPE